MKVKTQHRLIGGLVLLALTAIFLPLAFHRSEPAMHLRLSAKAPKSPAKPKVNLQLPSPSGMPSRSSSTMEQPNHVSSQTAKQAAERTPEVTSRILNTVPPPHPAAVSQSKKPTTTKKPVSVTSESSGQIFSETPPKAWVVQVASFSSKENASNLVEQLRSKGMDAYFRQVIADHATVTRVYVGPEINLAKVKQLQRVLAKKFGLSGVVKEYEIK